MKDKYINFLKMKSGFLFCKISLKEKNSVKPVYLRKLNNKNIGNLLESKNDF